MYVHAEAKVIYLAHPRTASASTSSALTTIGFERPVERDHHCKVYGPHSPVTPETREQWFVFTTVRNHWDAAVSWGYLSSSPPTAKIWNETIFKDVLTTPWIEPNRMWWHDQDADEILRFESLHRDFKRVLTACGLPTPELPHRNAAEGRSGRHYRQYYDGLAREYVAQRFKEEISKYDYTF